MNNNCRLKYKNHIYLVPSDKLSKFDYFKNHIHKTISELYDFSDIHICSETSFGYFADYFKDLQLFLKRIKSLDSLDVIIDLGIMFDFVNLYNVEIHIYLLVQLERLTNGKYVFPKFKLRKNYVSNSVYIYTTIIISYLLWLIKDKNTEKICQIIQNTYFNMHKEINLFCQVIQLSLDQLEQIETCCIKHAGDKQSNINKECQQYIDEYIITYDKYSVIYCIKMGEYIINITSSQHDIAFYSSIQKIIGNTKVDDLNNLDNVFNYIKKLNYDNSGIYQFGKPKPSVPSVLLPPPQPHITAAVRMIMSANSFRW